MSIQGNTFNIVMSLPLFDAYYLYNKLNIYDLAFIIMFILDIHVISFRINSLEYQEFL